MGLLNRYDPPAFLPDYNAIPGQLDAWNRAISAWFDAVVASERKLIGAQPQYYNAATFDPGGVLVEQAVTWNALDFIRNKERSDFRSSLAVPDSEVVQPTSRFHGGV